MIEVMMGLVRKPVISYNNTRRIVNYSGYILKKNNCLKVGIFF